MEENIREIIRRELPALVMRDPQIHDWVWHLIHDYAPARPETESRFEKMLAEIRAMREESERKWEENQRQLQAMREESERKWEENERKWEENERRWEENQRQLQAMREESERKWEENERKWEENSRRLDAILEEIKHTDHRIDRTVGAIGACWGASAEASFRNALKAILEDSFGAKVEQVVYRDESGEVFGRPDQVELDVIIRDGQVLVGEIKSAASRADIYLFERKVRSYEKRMQRKADRMILISPMVKEKDQAMARELGIEVYSDVEDVAS